MKFYCIAIAVSFWMLSSPSFAQTKINGRVCDQHHEPLVGANVYLLGSVEGAMSDSSGNFNFTVTDTGRVTLVVNCIGYEEWHEEGDVSHLNRLSIQLKEQFVSIDEVEVTASNFNIDGARNKKMNALDVVTTASSNGDIYGALQSLPGVQKQGKDGKLYVRGGASRETQTYMDGMHVLVPYTSNTTNTPSRGRFSPFLFKGVNLSLGGYDSEYGQALSSILPMQTKDPYTSNKLGVSFSPLDAGVGGTLSNGKQAWSFNSNYLNMKAYNKLFPDKYTWIDPYEQSASEIQYKANVSNTNVFKIYLGYDYTHYALPEQSFKENNYYLNSNYSGLFLQHYSFFVGLAYSKQKNTFYDIYETHLKSYVKRNFGDVYKLTLGAEEFLKDYDHLFAAFCVNQWHCCNHLYASLSSRVEHSTFNNQWSMLPRASLTYSYSNIQLSAIYGIYQQSPEDSILALGAQHLKQEVATHSIISASYHWKDYVAQVEIYHKEYSHLPLFSTINYTSNGYGSSNGIDVFLRGTFQQNLKYSVSYSYNHSLRIYNRYPCVATPSFACSQNVAVSLKYQIPVLLTYIGVSDEYSSGFPYTNAKEPGFNNATTSAYNSFSVNASILLSKRVILFSSITNLFNRHNIYGYTNEEPITASRDRFFYIGVFITLKSDAAYDVATF